MNQSRLRRSVVSALLLLCASSGAIAATTTEFSNCYQAKLTYQSSDAALFRSLEKNDQFENMLDSKQSVQVIYQRDQCSANPIIPLNPEKTASEPVVSPEEGDMRMISQIHDNIHYNFRQVYEKGKWRTNRFSRKLISVDLASN